MAVNNLDLRDNGGCFGCGANNPIGLKLRFELRDCRYVAEFTPMPEHQGFVGVTHGGILATLADEAMARLVWEEGNAALTAEFSMRFKQPAEVGKPLLVSGWVERSDGRLLFCRCEIRKPDGSLVAEATARMVRI